MYIVLLLNFCILNFINTSSWHTNDHNDDSISENKNESQMLSKSHNKIDDKHNNSTNSKVKEITKTNIYNEDEKLALKKCKFSDDFQDLKKDISVKTNDLSKTTYVKLLHSDDESSRIQVISKVNELLEVENENYKDNLKVK